MASMKNVVILTAALSSSCARHVPDAPGLAPGTPYVSWVFMSGDSENPDQEFVCQSHPRNECVVPVSRPDAQVFSDVHFYYHGGGAETKYEGSIDIGFFQGSLESHTTQGSITVKQNESIANQSIAGIVTSTRGTYAVTLSLTATVTDSGRTLPIRETVQVTVK